MNSNITVEVCVENLAGAKAAVEAGVQRIELCSALDVGGLTPDAALLESVLALPIETVVLIRPRVGDFVYDTEEVQLMQRSIELARAQGANSFAIGALLPDGSIDQDTMSLLIHGANRVYGAVAKVPAFSHPTVRPSLREGWEKAGTFATAPYTRLAPGPICFHRAFDGVRDPIGSLQVLADLGITRLLTSGQKQDAWAGAPLIAQLIEAAPASLEIMPGGGIRAHTIKEILEITGAQQVHFSARVKLPSPMKHVNPACDLHTPEHGTRYQTTSQEIERYLAKV